LPEEEGDLFGPYLDLMSPADWGRRGTVSSVKSASWVYRERSKMLEISFKSWFAQPVCFPVVAGLADAHA
jgi:hypothetical protein